MFVEAREVYNQEQREFNRKIDDAIDAITGTPEKDHGPVAPATWDTIAILTCPIWFALVGPEVAGVIAAGFVINGIRKALPSRRT